MKRRRIAPTKYARLVGYLCAQPEEQQAVTLTLAEIAILIEQPLPPSAQTQQFWTISDAAYCHWRLHGWRAARSHDSERVTFRREKQQAGPLDQAAIAAAYQAGATAPQLSRRYDLTAATVYAILRRAGVPRRAGKTGRPPDEQQ